MQRSIRLGVAILASAASLALSWPYWRDFQYWAESHSMWIAYFIVGFLLAVYVFYAFLDSLGTLFEHDALDQEKRSSGCCSSEADSGEGAS